MKSRTGIPRSLLVLETVGIIFLVVAWLSVNDFLALPQWLSNQSSAIVMIILGVVMMLPAAVALIVSMSRRVAPDLMTPHINKDKEKRDDANH